VKRPDIVGMERDKASMYIQRILKQEQNELPSGYGIWFNWYSYPELRRGYMSHPVMYKLNPWGPVRPRQEAMASAKIVSRLRKRGILGVRVTGPIELSPSAIRVREYERTRKIEYEQRLIEEWKKHHMSQHLARWGTTDNLDF
jgi:hypothetical protein